MHGPLRPRLGDGEEAQLELADGEGRRAARRPDLACRGSASSRRGPTRPTGTEG